ncbi:hypothetical protein DPMN_011540 [Dreissena polymorpha]|uniref:Uncharacterized protein n=1 Tax=Dreissena polymorpha TaxID=45954 RepID=A0A9D4N0S1_DREPO|nr:hypothetical protein DPMN_011540 [Dreissena polymorpha]
MSNTSSLYCVSDKRNLRFMNINGRSLGSRKSSELQEALQYIKPDIVFGSESRPKGIKPGKNPPQTLSNPAKPSQAIANHSETTEVTYGEEYLCKSMRTSSPRKGRVSDKLRS